MSQPDINRQILSAIGTACYALADLRRLTLDARIDRGSAVTGRAMRDLASLEQSLIGGFGGAVARAN